MRLILLIFALSFLLIGCGDKPPMPKLSVDEEEIDYELGSHFSKSLIKSVHADSAVPPLLVKETVIPESTLSIKFNKKPEKIVISEWKDGLPGCQLLWSTEKIRNSPVFTSFTLFTVCMREARWRFPPYKVSVSVVQGSKTRTLTRMKTLTVAARLN